MDIEVNQSWWDTYFQLVGAFSPQGSAVVYEGPIKVHGGIPGVDMDTGARVDKGLRYALAHPLPIRLSVGSHVSNFILYKNALLVSAQPMTEDSAQSEDQRLMARRGEISLTKGNVTAGNADIDRQRSSLNCGVVEQRDSAVYCGTRFTVRIPYEVADEAELVEAMNRGIRTDLSLYGDACENDCDLFHQEAEDLDPFDLLEEAIIRSS